VVELRRRGYRRFAAMIEQARHRSMRHAAGGESIKPDGILHCPEEREMRHKALRTLLVALFAGALLLPGLGASAGEQAAGAGKTPVVKQPIAPPEPEAESGVVAPGGRKAFNPQPEPPAREAEAEPGPVPPGAKKAIDPVDEKTIDPVDE
jgi:hypothetical protein